MGRKELTARLCAALRRFAGDERGIGAIEFAILFPVLVMLYLGAFELTIALSVEKRASRSAGSIADILTHRTDVNKTMLATMPSVASAIFAPYDATDLTLKISGVQLDASGNATVAWSWAQDGSKPYSTGSTVTVPVNIAQPSTFLVRTELTVPYQLISFGADFLPAGSSQITIGREYFYRPRSKDPITCSDC
ncbi:TadE/TadG family type IV pilus assembly protein [Rhizobium mayense]|uniref:Pilus assembly protein n=1 Tax=Rhizobium mayense TaxID=1312184 RepID=A0ABT7JWP2_9HYPH|nr:TadE/TadG family type IV pilus assembly protein [Rhizobium mayense]MDL2400160.1 pilus assembly protein [Rhizobium mayense]